MLHNFDKFLILVDDLMQFCYLLILHLIISYSIFTCMALCLRIKITQLYVIFTNKKSVKNENVIHIS